MVKCAEPSWPLSLLPNLLLPPAREPTLSDLDLNKNKGNMSGEQEDQGKSLPAEVEKSEEAKLASKYPGKPMAAHSGFLQKRLAKGQKYFDSGDYQVAKQTGKLGNFPQGKPRMPILSVAPEVPPSESGVSTRKISIAQPSKLAN